VVADAANGWELRVVSAVVVGGVAIVGGTGTVYGAALGALLITTIGSVLVVLKVNSFWQDAITGVLLLLAISVDRLLALRVTRALRVKSRSRRGRRRPGGDGAASAGTAVDDPEPAAKEGRARDEI
jgi:rhamnose transport system permease protein